MGERRIEIINGYFRKSEHIFGNRPPIVADVRSNDLGTFYILDNDFVVTPQIRNDVATQLGATMGRYEFDTHSSNKAPCRAEQTALFFSNSFNPMSLPLPLFRIGTAFGLFILLVVVYFHYNSMKEIYDI
jgi:hypothetical protein